jgi:phosphoglycerate dehydrogenase-like enzyme
MKPRAVVAPGKTRLDSVCSPECRALIEQHFDPLFNDGGELSLPELEDRLEGASVLLTSWGSPALGEETLRGAPDLVAIGHAAGSVKRLVPQGAFGRKVAVFSAARRIADSVAEYCLAATLTLLRRLPSFDADMRAGRWREAPIRGRELTGAHVGIVGASSTARAFLRLLSPFGVTVDVYDPYLREFDAAELGARKASLDTVLHREIVSVHAPATSETERMIDRRLLAGMPDGGILINSSRGATIDQDALFEELADGRILAALDVFDTEPPTLPPHIRDAPNVLLSPHIAGNTAEGHRALMEYVVRDIVTWLDRGQAGPSWVDPRSWNIAA